MPRKKKTKTTELGSSWIKAEKLNEKTKAQKILDKEKARELSGNYKYIEICNRPLTMKMVKL